MKRLACYTASLLAVPLLLGSGVLAISGHCASPKAAAPPPPLTDSVTAQAKALSNAYAAVAGHVRPAVVSVYSEKFIKYQTPDNLFPSEGDFFQQFFGQQGPSHRQAPREQKVPQRGMGSGMLLDKAGHILTNYHVVKDADDLKVRLSDKREFKAVLVSADPKTDVAVIRIKDKVPADLPIVQLGDSDQLQVGEVVMAVGAPLVNMKGEVIGMNSAIATSSGQSSGIGFAIPSNMISRMLPTLIKGGRIARGLLGVGVQDLDKDLAQQFSLNDESGALVTTVSPDSAAAKAGIKVGDAITSMNGHAVVNSRDLRNRIGSAAPGSKVKLSVMRDGKELLLMATIGEAPTGGAAAGPAEHAPQQATKLGLSVQPLTPDLAQQFGLTAKSGLVIIDVDQGSAAARAGLQQGDLILEVNRKPVNNVGELNSAVASSRNAGSVLLLVKRTNASMFVALPVQ